MFLSIKRKEKGGKRRGRRDDLFLRALQKNLSALCGWKKES